MKKIRKNICFNNRDQILTLFIQKHCPSCIAKKNLIKQFYKNCDDTKNELFCFMFYQKIHFRFFMKNCNDFISFVYSNMNKRKKKQSQTQNQNKIQNLTTKKIRHKNKKKRFDRTFCFFELKIFWRVNDKMSIVILIDLCFNYVFVNKR